MIREAAEFAERAHEGVYRKGTKIPYAGIMGMATDDVRIRQAPELAKAAGLPRVEESILIRN